MNNNKLDYKLIRSKRRTIALQVNSSAELVVRAPRFVTKRVIENFIDEKRSWIIDKLDIKRRQKEILENHREEKTENWCKEQKKRARLVFKNRIEYFEGLTGLKVNKLRLSSAKTRWGSCSFNGTISLVWRLIMAPTEVLDYVVLHEIMHLKHANHSKEYWNALEEYMPDYKKHRIWLKENGFTLNI